MGRFRIDPEQYLAATPAAAPLQLVVGAAPTAASGGPGGISGQELADAVGAQLAGPHDGVSTDYDSTARTITLANEDKGSIAVSAHLGATDPHGDRAYAVAQDTAAIAAHVAAANPHPQYLTTANVDGGSAASTYLAAQVINGGGA